MLTVYGIRHTQLAVAVILNEGIETASVHIRLKNYLGLSNIICIYFKYSDVFSVGRGIEQIKVIPVVNKVGAGLTVAYKNRFCPFSRNQIITGEYSVVCS